MTSSSSSSSMSSLTLTPQLLEALMSPNNSIRSQAETVYGSITPVESRVEGLMRLFMELLMHHQQNSSTATTTLSVFVCILLRRDILKLKQPALLEQLVEPLLTCFVGLSGNVANQQQIQNGIGHCLAEICASLSILPIMTSSTSASSSTSTTATHVVLTKIIQQIKPDDGGLALLSMIADRSPVTYTHVVIAQVPQFIQHCLSTASTSSTWKRIELCFRLLISSAIATTVTTVSLIPTSAPNVDELRVDTTCVASQLGVSTLKPLLHLFMTTLTATATATTSTQVGLDEDCQQQCLQHMSNAALTVPSLICGSVDVLQDVVRMVCNIITVAAADCESNKSSSLSLAALQVVSNICSVPAVRHTVLFQNPEIVQTICQQAIPICVQYMAGNDDDDDDEEEMMMIDWITEPANLLDNDGSNDSITSSNEQIQLAQSILESLLSSLSNPALTVALSWAQRLLEQQQQQQQQHQDGGGSGELGRSWKYTWAGLAVLETAVVAAPNALSTHVNDLVHAGCSHASASASASGQQASAAAAGAAAGIVQYQALRLLATLCEVPVKAITGPIYSQFSRTVLEQFATALSSPTSKISAMGSTGIISYCRGGSGGYDDANDNDDDGNVVTVSQSLAPYMGHLLQALINGPLSLMGTDTGSIAVRVRAMDATACLAAACTIDDDSDDGPTSAMFSPFYQTVMPGLMATAQLPQPDLATSALRSLAIVGSAVEEELFQADAKQVLSWIVPVLASSSSSSGNAEGGSSSSGISTEELLTATARIASVLKDDFAPYIGSVLPTVLRIAQESNDVSILEGNESGVSSPSSTGKGDDGESMTVALPGKGFTKLTINTYKIQEKASNNRVLYELAKALGASLGPHVPGLFDVMIPLINFPYSSDVRSTAAQASSALFQSACLYGADVCGGNMQCPQHYLPMLSEAISRQISQEDTSDKEALYGSADSLSEIFYITQDKFKSFRSGILGRFSIQNAEEVVQRCIKTLVDCLDRRSTVTRMLKGTLTGLDEKEDYEAQLQSEDGLLTPLTDSIGYLLKFFGPAFLPLFDKYIVPILSQYISSTSDARASTAAFCLFDDCIEYCGSDAASKYAPVLLPGIVTVLREPAEYGVDLIQASVYGVAQMARYSPSNLLAGSIQTLVQQLMLLTQGGKDDSPAGTYLYEISISALASLVLWGPFQNLKGLNVASIQDRFLGSLPIQQNDDEAKICHAGLCGLIENGSINLQEEAFRLTQVIGSILFYVEEGEDIASQDTCDQLAAILVGLQQQSPHIVQKAYAGLDCDVQAAVGAAMQGRAVQSRANLVTPEK